MAGIYLQYKTAISEWDFEPFRKKSGSQLRLDIVGEGSSIDTSPPIHFRIEWAGSQGMSPLLGRRPI
jgi:hypothetical protein